MLDLEVAKRQLGIDLILIASADLGAVDIAAVDQVGHDSLHRPVSDPGPFGHIGHSDRRVFSKAQKYDQMAGHERPLTLGRTRFRGRRHDGMLETRRLI